MDSRRSNGFRCHWPPGDVGVGVGNEGKPRTWESRPLRKQMHTHTHTYKHTHNYVERKTGDFVFVLFFRYLCVIGRKDIEDDYGCKGGYCRYLLWLQIQSLWPQKNFFPTRKISCWSCNLEYRCLFGFYLYIFIWF